MTEISPLITENRRFNVACIMNFHTSARALSCCGKMRSVLPSDLNHGIELFNRGEFFDAHEVLEDVWRAAPEEEKKFLQGIIQVAVAFYHYGNGNSIGACSVLRRGVSKSVPLSGRFRRRRIADLLHSISDWQRAMDEGTPVPALPKIVIEPNNQQNVAGQSSPVF